MKMEQIKYTRRICDDQERIQEFLTQKRVGTLGLCDENGRPYAIPVNYLYWQGKIFFHGLGSGKKNDILATNGTVCFNVFEEFGTVADTMPAKCDTAYFSVVIFGKVVAVTEATEKAAILDEFVEKFMPNHFKTKLAPRFVDQYHSSLDSNVVAVYCLEPEELTAKENPVDPDNMFQSK
jgi:hypothetical protein